MRRRKAAPVLSEDSSEDDEPLSKISNNAKLKQLQLPQNSDNESSSDSDIETYLQPINKLDLSSPFFNTQKNAENTFDKIGKKILAGVSSALTDSDSEQEQVPTESTVYYNFDKLAEYNKAIEETKKAVEKYEAKKSTQNDHLDVTNLLTAGESMLGRGKEKFLTDLQGSLHSSDFDSCSDSEKEAWEEIKTKEKDVEKEKVAREGIQITVDMPVVMKKKKGVDLITAMKRRFNRIKKENQVLIHKVHLLCWIAHGNCVSAAINSQNVLGLALSLLPSKCYPADRIDLTYLEQIVKWFRNTVVNLEKIVPKQLNLEGLLEVQLKKKETFNKKMFVYIFIAVLRSLGIQCRLVLSFQLQPLRPPSSELCSLSTKESSSKKGVSLNTSRSRSGKINSKARVDATDQTKQTSRRESISLNTSKAGPSKIMSKAQVGITGKQSSSRKSISFNTSKAGPSKTMSKAQVCVKGEPKVKVGKLKAQIEKNLAVTKKESQPVAKEPIQKQDNLKVDKLKTKLRSKSASTVNEASSTKAAKDKGKSKEIKSEVKKENKASLEIKNTRTRSKSASSAETLEKSKVAMAKRRNQVPNVETAPPKKPKKEIIKVKLPPRSKKVPQLDGMFDSDDDIVQLDGGNDKATTSKPNLRKLKVKESTSCPIKNHPKRLKTKITKYRDTDSEEDFRPRSPFSPKNNGSPSSQPSARVNLKKLKSPINKKASDGDNSKYFDLAANGDVRDDIIKLVKGRIKEVKHLDKLKTGKKRLTRDESDSDYAPAIVKKKHHDSGDEFKPKVKQRVQVKSRKVLSSDSEDGSNSQKKKNGMDVWAEVFLENEENWISVDLIKGQVHCINELYTRATHPLSYIVAWNNDNSVKDITRKYCQNFNTLTRKLRVDAKWWEAALKPFMGPRNARDREEDDELERQQLEKPLPKSIVEYKNHPLYVLKRHLLKFEALYPAETPTLGFVRNEPVYSRQCVYTLHSREMWVKQAKVVKLGETPYKIVKARPKYDKLSNTIITDQLLEIFGPWQTEDYVPPTAENGVVPRNAFGNVELFKACMLPKKTVHLQLSGLNKVARRMNIDCAPAIVGFDFHSGWSHPTYDGFVVCEEFADILVAAWELEQDEIVKREQEKVEKRVYGNWRKLIKGLLIRERLKNKYDFGEPSGSGGQPKKKNKGSRLVVKKRKMCSDSESE